MAATARFLDRLTVTPIPGGWKIGGEVDASTAPALAEALATHRPDIAGKHLVVDLSDIGFMDSSGLGALLDARGRVAADGGVLILRRPSRCVTRLLDITHLRRAFRIEQQQVFLRHHQHRRRVSNHGQRPSRR
jgi:anti-sigma B factor antagonist